MVYIFIDLSLSFWIIDLRYLKHFITNIFWPSRMITSYSLFFLFLNLHSIYSVCNLFNLNPQASRVCLHNFNFVLTHSLVSSINTISSVKSIHQGISSWTFYVISSITMTKRTWLKVDLWYTLIVIENSSVNPPQVLMFVAIPSYLSLIILIYLKGHTFLFKPTKPSL